MDMINSVQLVVHLPLFDILLIAFASMFFAQMMKIAAFTAVLRLASVRLQASPINSPATASVTVPSFWCSHTANHRQYFVAGVDQELLDLLAHGVLWL
jgi:hypothetical protein